MLKIIGAFVVTLLGGMALLYIEYCWFDSENCSFQASSLMKSDHTEPKIATATVNLSVPFFDCKKSSVDSQGVDDCEPINPLAFKINYLYQNGGKGDFQPFGEGSVLHSGDSLKLLFKPTEAVYVYIFIVDSHGNIARLFPTADLRGASNRNPVQKGLQYFVPAAQNSFRLDQNTGQESLYFIATRQAEALLEQQYQKLFIAQQAQAVERITLIQEQLLFEFQKKEKQRLIEPKWVSDVPSEPISFEEGGKRFSVWPAYLKNLCEGCVYRVTFKHDL